MPDTAYAPAFARQPEVGNTLAYMGSLVSFIVNAKETGGGFSLMQAHATPGNEPPPHVHDVEHEIIHAIDGVTEFYVEGVEDSITLNPGETIFLPCGRAHAMKIRSEVRWLIIIHAADGGEVTLEDMFRQMAIGPAVSMDMPQNMERYADLSQSAVKEIQPRGMTFLSPEEAARRIPNYPGFGAGPG